MSRGNYRLIGSSGSLIAGEWDHVYAQLIAQPEASQYRYLQVGGGGRGWVLRLTSQREDFKRAFASTSVM